MYVRPTYSTTYSNDADEQAHPQSWKSPVPPPKIDLFQYKIQ